MSYQPPQIYGQSPAFLAILDQISLSAALDGPICVVGEAGSGKTAIAGRLHFLSPRWEGTFERVDCRLDPDLALEDYAHLDGGTLCVESVEALSPAAQIHLLSFLESGRTDDFGEDDTVDIRIIATSRVDLTGLAAQGAFDPDLLRALSFDVLTLPPLRMRREDILPLAERFALQTAKTLGADLFPGFSAELQSRLEEARWPGNIRHLKAAIARAVGQAYSHDDTLSEPIAALYASPFASPFASDTPQAATSNTPPEIATTPNSSAPPPGAQPKDFAARTLAFERALIDEALSVGAHHQGKAADYLGLTYHQFRGLLRKHGLKK